LIGAFLVGASTFVANLMGVFDHFYKQGDNVATAPAPVSVPDQNDAGPGSVSGSQAAESVRRQPAVPTRTQSPPRQISSQPPAPLPPATASVNSIHVDRSPGAITGAVVTINNVNTSVEPER
jgi:hypothetical protein